jgi:hypothetical protein
VGRTANTLQSTSAEEIVAGAMGAVGGVLVGVGVTWPVFIIDRPSLTVPIFGFVVVTLGMLGYRLAATRRETILGFFGARAVYGAAQHAHARPARVVDTSVAIDGPLGRVVRAGFLHGRMLLAAPVISELQAWPTLGTTSAVRAVDGASRCSSAAPRAGHRGPGHRRRPAEIHDVDAKLVRICLERGAVCSRSTPTWPRPPSSPVSG